MGNRPRRPGGLVLPDGILNVPFRQGFTPSAGQVASILLSMALRSVTTDLKDGSGEQADYAAVLAKELTSRQEAEKAE